VTILYTDGDVKSNANRAWGGGKYIRLSLNCYARDDMKMHLQPPFSEGRKKIPFRTSILNGILNGCFCCFEGVVGQACNGEGVNDFLNLATLADIELSVSRGLV